MSARTFRFFIPFVISAVLLIVVIRGLEGEASQLTAALSAADWRLFVPALVLYFIGVWLRSARWSMLLPGYPVPITTLLQALVVGFTVNNLLPLRMGEVARAILLSRWCRVPYGASAASLVVERVLDGLSLAMLLLVALTLVPAPGYLVLVGILAAAGFLAGAAIVAVAAWRSSVLIVVAEMLSRRLPPTLGGRLRRLAENFAQSLALVHDPVRLVRLLGLSLLAWCFELGLFYVLLIAFGISSSYPMALLVGSAANFATLVPSSPGYVGTFDGALIGVLRDVAGISAGLAAAYDVIVHTALFLPVVIVGTLVLWRRHITFNQITHAPDRSAAPPAGQAA